MQFKETMRLKMEVGKRHAKNSKATVVEEETQVDHIATTSVSTQTDPVEQLFEDREYALMAKVQT